MSRESWAMRISAAARTFRGRHRCVGVDLGSAYLKLVAVERNPSQWRCCFAASVPTPPGCIASGAVADPGAVAEVLRGLVTKAGLRRQAAVVGLPLAVTTCRRIAIPAGGRRALERAARAAMDRWELDPQRSWTIDWSLLAAGPSAAEAAVLLVAAPTEVVLDYVDCVRAAGLMPIAVDVDAFVLERLARGAGVRTGAVLDLGAAHCGVNVLRGGHSTLHASIEHGGRIAAGDSRLHPPQALAAAAPDAGAIADVRQLIESVKYEAGDEVLDELWLTGGGAAASEVVDGLLAGLDARVRVIEPGAWMAMEQGARGPQFGVATGLALRGSGYR